MLERVNGMVADLKTNPPPLPVDEIAEAIQFLQWLLADNFTFLGLRNYSVRRQCAGAGFRQRARHHALARIARAQRGDELLEFTPEIMAFLKEPRLLIIAKANIHARVHRRVYLDYIGVKRFDADGNLVGELRIVGLFTSTAYTRTAHSIPYLRRKIAGVRAARRLRRQQPFRQGAGQRAGALSARRTVPDRRGHALSFRARHPAARRASARARAGAARPLRPFRVGAGLRAARPLRQRHPRAASATISAAPSSAASRRSIRSFRKARWCACISSSAAPAAPRRRSTPPRWSARSRRSCAPGPTGSPRRLALSNPPDKARELFARYRDAFSAGFHEAYAPAVAAADIRDDRRADGAAPARRRFPSPHAEEAQRASA